MYIYIYIYIYIWCVCVYIHIYIYIYIHICIYPFRSRLARSSPPSAGTTFGSVETVLANICIYIYIYIYIIYIYIYNVHYSSIIINAHAYITLFTLLDPCASSVRRGHATLLCVVPMLTDDPRRKSKMCMHTSNECIHSQSQSQGCIPTFGHGCTRQNGAASE